jgi:hypothetical protein
MNTSIGQPELPVWVRVIGFAATLLSISWLVMWMAAATR